MPLSPLSRTAPGLLVLPILLVLPVLLILLILGRANPARAQPVSTEDKVIRARVGLQTVPTRDRATQKTVIQQRTFADFLYRFWTDVDIGFALPTVTLDPEFGAANPLLFGFFHIFHQPHWMALRWEFEPPLLLPGNGWRLSLYLPSTLRIGKRVEFFNLPGIRLRLDETQDTFYTWHSAAIVLATPTFGIGPSATVRFTNDGFDEVLVGGRLRWEWRDHVRTRGVLFIDLATSSPRPTGQSIAVLAYYQFFIRM